MKKQILLVEENIAGVMAAILIGGTAYFISSKIESDLADPLIIALVSGIIAGSFLSKKNIVKGSFSMIPYLFIPFGIIFYGLNNLNFASALEINPLVIILLLTVILSYYFVSIIVGKVLGQKKEITYLTATGGAICGASAITVIAPAVEADSEDVSISLLAVTVAGIFGLFVLLPFMGVFLNLSNEAYALLSGSVLQFTGFVKMSVVSMPPLSETIQSDKILEYALSIKAFRYLGLLLAIPLFASLSRKKLIVPWYLWAFLGAGLLGTYLFINNQGLYLNTIRPIIKPAYTILWSISIAAIGMNTNIGKLISNEGIKALIIAFIGFFAAISVFLLGIDLII